MANCQTALSLKNNNDLTTTDLFDLFQGKIKLIEGEEKNPFYKYRQKLFAEDKTKVNIIKTKKDFMKRWRSLSFNEITKQYKVGRSNPFFYEVLSDFPSVRHGFVSQFCISGGSTGFHRFAFSFKPVLGSDVEDYFGLLSIKHPKIIYTNSSPAVDKDTGVADFLLFRHKYDQGLFAHYHDIDGQTNRIYDLDIFGLLIDFYDDFKSSAESFLNFEYTRKYCVSRNSWDDGNCGDFSHIPAIRMLDAYGEMDRSRFKKGVGKDKVKAGIERAKCFDAERELYKVGNGKVGLADGACQKLGAIPFTPQQNEKIKARTQIYKEIKHHAPQTQL